MRLGYTIFVLATVLSATAHAQESVKARLQYRDEGFHLPLVMSRHAEVKFAALPQGSRGNIQGYAIITGSSGEGKGFIGLGLDPGADTLYVDVDRDLDLASDPGEKFRMGGRVGYHGIHVVTPPPSLRRYCLYIDRESLWHVSEEIGYVRSGWEGQVTLDGEPWTVAVADNLDGVIQNNPRYAHNQDLLLVYRDRGLLLDAWGRSVLYGGPAEPDLWLNGRHYRVDYAFVPDGNDGAVDVTFSEVPEPEVGWIEVMGQGIERLVLEGLIRVDLAAPAGVVAVPPGVYSRQQVRMYDTVHKLCYESIRTQPLRVEKGQTVRLKIGGPLDSRVMARRSGARLQLDYALVGAGGEQYSVVQRPDRGPERVLGSFRATHDGKKVASGNFEYG